MHAMRRIMVIYIEPVLKELKSIKTIVLTH